MLHRISYCSRLFQKKSKFLSKICLISKPKFIHNSHFSMDKCQFQRLPTLITPLNYQISLTPDLTKLTFDGVEIIKLKVNQSTDEIVLNSKQLNIDSNEAKSFVLLPKENKGKSVCYENNFLNY